MPPQNAPDFIPAESSPDFIPASQSQNAETLKRPFGTRLREFLGNVFNPPLGPGPQPGEAVAPGTNIPLRQAVSEGSSVASLGLGLSGSRMGLPEPDMTALVGDIGKGLGNVRLRAPELTDAEKLQVSIDKAMARRAGLQAAKEKISGVPAESLTKSPNYPKILAGRALAREAAREALETKAQTGNPPRLSKSGVLRLPEPREALPTDTPGYLSSIPRERLPGLAMQGYPGAGELLRNLGKPVLYVPPEGYPNPRLQLPKPLEFPGRYDLAAD